MGGADENGWLSNIHSASSSRSASLANSSIAQVYLIITNNGEWSVNTSLNWKKYKSRIFCSAE